MINRDEQYYKLLSKLRKYGTAEIGLPGSSMRTLIVPGSTLTYEVCEEYDIDDIVFCKIGGRFINGHKITKKDANRYLISNGLGKDNGWTDTIYAKVVKIAPPVPNGLILIS